MRLIIQKLWLLVSVVTLNCVVLQRNNRISLTWFDVGGSYFAHGFPMECRCQQWFQTPDMAINAIYLKFVHMACYPYLLVYSNGSY